MFFSTAAVVATLASVAVAAPASPTATDPADVYAAQATALTQSPTSKVKGRAFDRYVSIVWNLFFVCPTGSCLIALSVQETKHSTHPQSYSEKQRC